MKWRKTRRTEQEIIEEALSMVADPVREAMHAMADAVTRLAVRVETLSESVGGLAAATAESRQELTLIGKRLDELAEERG